MGEMTETQLISAKNMAELALTASGAVEQAGRGLAVVYDKCRANAADNITLTELIAAQGYVNDALMALHQREAYRRHSEAKIVGLELPDGD